MRSPNPRERRLLALAGLVALLAVVQLAIVQPIIDGFAERGARREELLTWYEHNARTIAAIPRLRRQAEQQRGVAALYSIAAPSLDTAREVLRERLQRAVEAVGGEFRRGDDASAAAGWVSARADARLTLEQLATMIAQLQNRPPLLVVQTLTVAADEALVVGRPGPLEVRIEVAIPLRLAQAR